VTDLSKTFEITNGEGSVAPPDLAPAMRLKQHSEQSWYGLGALMQSGWTVRCSGGRFHESGQLAVEALPGGLGDLAEAVVGALVVRVGGVDARRLRLPLRRRPRHGVPLSHRRARVGGIDGTLG
jgi:hypothetical protein